jgi:hypothetical protein
MAGCEPLPTGGDPAWGIKRVFLGWGGTGATLGAAAALTAAQLGGLALAAGSTAGIALLGAAGGYLIGVGVGNAIFWFTRLEENQPSPLTIQGRILCAGKNTGVPPFNDNDWTFNVGDLRVVTAPGPSVEALRTQAPPGRQAFPSLNHPSTRCPGSVGGEPMLHCEIGSAVGDGAAIGGAVGSVAGAVAGGLIAAAVGCAVLGVFTFGLGCLLAILIGVAVGALAGLVVGDLVGAGIGWIVDQARDFDRRGKEIRCDCVMFLSGPWVTDIGHQHNEIHDIDRAVAVECDLGSVEEGLTVAAAVGTGRHPQGPDP